MSNSPDSTPSGVEETETRISSPETLPPGFENPSFPPIPTSPHLENLADSLLSPPPPFPRENQISPTHCPSPPLPQKVQSFHSPLNPMDENCGILPNSVQQHEIPVSLSTPSTQSQHERQDAVSQVSLQQQDGQDPLVLSKLPQGNQRSPLPPPPPRSLLEMGQMVCGNCNELLSYPRGTKYLQCACCHTINFVLEAHQVGIVNCEKCLLLLMYPYAAKSLRCSSCHHVTEIGIHNVRPPVSVLQGFPPATSNGAC